LKTHLYQAKPIPDLTRPAHHIAGFPVFTEEYGASRRFFQLNVGNPLAEASADTRVTSRRQPGGFSQFVNQVKGVVLTWLSPGSVLAFF